MIWIEKHKKKQPVFLQEIVQWTRVPYLSSLCFSNLFLMRKLMRQGAALEKRGELTFSQTWLGKYFRDEIVFGKIAPVCLRWIDDRLGWGVFAERGLFKMDFVAEYAGVVRKKNKDDRYNSYCFEYALTVEKKAYCNIDAREHGGIARYINHSKSGNLETALATVDGISHVILFAKRDILPGEQLLYDYGPDYWRRRGAPVEA